MTETPFGIMGGTGPAAPTKVKVATNPGAWDGTVFDPTDWLVVPAALAAFARVDLAAVAGVTTFAGFYRIDREGALALFASGGQYGYPLNIGALTAAQKERLGIKPDAYVTNEALQRQLNVVESQNTAIMAALYK